MVKKVKTPPQFEIPPLPKNPKEDEEIDLLSNDELFSLERDLRWQMEADKRDLLQGKELNLTVEESFTRNFRWQRAKRTLIKRMNSGLVTKGEALKFKASMVKRH